MGMGMMIDFENPMGMSMVWEWLLKMDMRANIAIPAPPPSLPPFLYKSIFTKDMYLDLNNHAFNITCICMLPTHFLRSLFTYYLTFKGD